MLPKQPTLIRPLAFLLVLAMLAPPAVKAQRQKKNNGDAVQDSLKRSTFSGLKWRSIGPAMTSGRIADFAVNPANPKEYYVAVASGHVWKTQNAGITWAPIFDNYGSYSVGVVTMDPNNHNVIWVGTGENNHQRALGYGNGVYRSLDGGKSFRNMGLKNSRQIGGIVIDPRCSDVVFVAAEGSVWGPGGERGLYKSTDGGETWKKVIAISENTGINNVVMDPARPDILYATAEQRRRHVHTKIGGGPESAVYKSTDGGETWRKVMKGLPNVHLGGMGIAVSPADPDMVYLMVEAAEGKGGFFRSQNRGESWDRMSHHHSSGQYYNEIVCDPLDVDVVYSTETRSKMTRDGGKTWNTLGLEGRHVDDHALWIDPSDTEHLLIGGDGGIYESFDGGENWDYKANLPVTQFYRVAVDNDYPFYNVYGGTQDNNTLGGPSRNTSTFGVTNEDWSAIKGGDGFWVAVDPGNPDIIYCESQYGNVARYDRKSGERINIKPAPGKGEDTYKWNWDTPLIISPHSNTRLYIAANKVFRSDDRGDTWTVISEDITARMDRNTWPVMGQYWSADAVAKDVSTSLFGMAVSLDESRKKEDLLYVGTDDGVISVTRDAGENWTQVKSFPGVPARTYVSDVLADKFDENVVYATFNNHKRDDFKPYVLKSTDQGKTWETISNGLPENGSVWTIEQDFVNPDLLFLGTEFSAYFSMDGGREWVELGSGLPDIAVRDLVIQERENDLVMATFGRGFYILDDFTPLREFNRGILEKRAHLFPLTTARMYIQTGGKYGQGSNFFASKNPPFGATFTFYLKEVPKTLKAIRQEKEKQLFKEKQPIPQPGIEELRAEEQELPPYFVFSIRDTGGKEIRKLTRKAAQGINRLTWDLTYPSLRPVSGELKEFTPVEASGRSGGRGSRMPVLPGTYTVTLSLVSRDGAEELAGPVQFRAEVLELSTLPVENMQELVSFQSQISSLAGTMSAAENFAADLQRQLLLVRQTLHQTPGTPEALTKQASEIDQQIEEVMFIFEGPKARASQEEIPPFPMPLNRRLSALVNAHIASTSGVTGTEKMNYEILRKELQPVLEKLKSIHQELDLLGDELDKLGAPWTPGRVPTLK